jgi:hypothetical protein
LADTSQTVGANLRRRTRFLPNILGDGNKIDRIRSGIDEQAYTASFGEVRQKAACAWLI